MRAVSSLDTYVAGGFPPDPWRQPRSEARKIDCATQLAPACFSPHVLRGEMKGSPFGMSLESAYLTFVHAASIFAMFTSVKSLFLAPVTSLKISFVSPMFFLQTATFLLMVDGELVSSPMLDVGGCGVGCRSE